MKVLILIAHGSRVPNANQEIVELTKSLHNKLQPLYSCVVPAFLEIASPSIPIAMQQCIDDGADELVLLPYFLASGKHVETDIPSQVELKRSEHPSVKVTLLDYFGKSPDIVTTLAKQVEG